jgi:hypothetical protein
MSHEFNFGATGSVPSVPDPTPGARFHRHAGVTLCVRGTTAGTHDKQLDRLLLNRYLRVGQLIDFVQAKARLSLSQSKA